MLERFWLPSVVTAGRIPEPLVPKREEEDKGPFLLNAEVAVSLLESEQAQKLFTNLFDSQEFKEKIQKVKGILNQPLSQKRLNSLKHFLAGSLFEILCFHFLQKKVKPGEVLLSPKETLNLYYFLYPQKAIPHFYGLDLEIKGITVPDGLLFSSNHDTTMITAVCEYALAKDKIFIPEERQFKQFRHYQEATFVLDNLFPFGFPFRQKFLGDFLHQLHPELPTELEANADLQLIYVTTQGNEIPLKGSQSQILTVSCSSQEFGWVARGIFQDLGLED